MHRHVIQMKLWLVHVSVKSRINGVSLLMDLLVWIQLKKCEFAKMKWGNSTQTFCTLLQVMDSQTCPVPCEYHTVMWKCHSLEQENLPQLGYSHRAWSYQRTKATLLPASLRLNAVETRHKQNKKKPEHKSVNILGIQAKCMSASLIMWCFYLLGKFFKNLLLCWKFITKYLFTQHKNLMKGL